MTKTTANKRLAKMWAEVTRVSTFVILLSSISSLTL